MTPDEIAAIPFRDLLQAMGMTQAECSRRFSIPLRTIQNWVSDVPGNHRDCPAYVRLMMAEITGIKTEC